LEKWHRIAYLQSVIFGAMLNLELEFPDDLLIVLPLINPHLLMYLPILIIVPDQPLEHRKLRLHTLILLLQLLELRRVVSRLFQSQLQLRILLKQ
jgi:hypothetical protein